MLASKHDTQHPDRRGVSNVHFDWQVPADADDKPHRIRKISKILTTEGRVWEWMYGMGEDVPGVTPGQKISTTRLQSSPLRQLFKDMVFRLPCVFCSTQLSIKDDVATCDNRHAFGTKSNLLFPFFTWLLSLLTLHNSHMRHIRHSHPGTRHIPRMRRLQDALPQSI